MPDRPIPNLACTWDFLEFNFSELADPEFRTRVPSQRLYELVYQARNGSKTARIEFCDAFRWSSTQAAFEAFLRACGPRPITYEDWFYEKVAQFLAVLTYQELHWNGIREVEGEARFNPLAPRTTEEGDMILGSYGMVTDADELRRIFPWSEVEEIDWIEIFCTVLQAGSNWGDRLRAILDEYSVATKPAERRGWIRNSERDRVIRELIERGADHERICLELDRRLIAVLPKLAAHGVRSWHDGYGHPDCQNAIQQLFSKVPSRAQGGKRKSPS